MRAASRRNVSPGSGMSRMRGDSGFTLIELMVVVAVIGILASIAIPALQTALDKGKQRATMADMRGIASGIQIYQVDESIFPADGITSLALVTLLQPQTKAIMPSRDAWHHDFVYHTDDHTWYSLESFGKDGIDGIDITFATRLQFDLDMVYATGRFSNAPE